MSVCRCGKGLGTELLQWRILVFRKTLTHGHISDAFKLISSPNFTWMDIISLDCHWYHQGWRDICSDLLRETSSSNPPSCHLGEACLNWVGNWTQRLFDQTPGLPTGFDLAFPPVIRALQEQIFLLLLGRVYSWSSLPPHLSRTSLLSYFVFHDCHLGRRDGA